MAALYGMGIDNARVEVEGPEVPACDGSAAEWAELLGRAGCVRLDAERRSGRLRRGVWAVANGGWAVVSPAGPGLSLSVGVDYSGTAAGTQTLWMRVTRSSFARELAPARTFASEEELEALRAEGYALGGSEEHAFAVGRDGYSGALRYPDEVVRHKALDLLGDLALCGWPLQGQVTAVRPGHHLNVQLARAVRAALGEQGRDEERVT
jgi:UDP-3-O-[3-hydroxymyristoyl] N-acetylglucosamine deacetylase